MDIGEYEHSFRGLTANEIHRQAFFSITLLNDAQIMKDILNDIWYPAVQPLLKVEGFLGTLVFQVITEPIIEKFSKAGGNALGITAEQGPLMGEHRNVDK